MACGVFGFLILTALGVKLIVMREVPDGSLTAQTPSTENKPNDQVELDPELVALPKASLPADSGLSSDSLPTAPPISELTEDKVPVGVDDSKYEVLPPVAAAMKERKLPGILRVGDEKGSFRELHTAIESMVPGDIIEIRTNRILTVEPCLIGKQNPQEIEALDLPPLTIRAAAGYFPLIRVAQVGPLFRVNHRTIILQNLHFAAREKVVTWFEGEGNLLLAEGCSVTGGVLLGVTGTKDSRPSNIWIDRCMIRNAAIGVGWGGALRDLAIFRSAMMGSGQTFFGPGEHRISIQRSTFLMSYIADVGQGPNDPLPSIRLLMDHCIFQQFACCPRITGVGVKPEYFPQTADQVPATFRRLHPVFNVTNSVLSFHAPDGINEGFATIGSTGPGLPNNGNWGVRSSHFPMIEQQLLKLGLTPRANAAQDGCWNGLGGKDPAFPATFDLDRADLVFTTDKPAIQELLNRREVGCIPEWLTPVPTQAMELYEARPLPP